MTPSMLAAMSVGSSVVAAIGAVMALTWMARSRTKARSLVTPGPTGAVVLVEDERILDASAAARDLLEGLGEGGWSWPHLEKHLTMVYPGFAEARRGIEDRRENTITSRDGVGTLTIRADGARLRLTFDEGETGRIAFDRVSFAAMEDELAALRSIGDALPQPVWRQRRDGTVTWLNRAYLDLVAERRPDDCGLWPPPALFSEPPPDPGQARRMALTCEQTGEISWYDCRTIAIGNEMLCAAADANAAVSAERTLKEVVQTMSRTFAHLTVGLAVFDRSKRLVVFNPALTDLTELPIDLMLSRPTLDSFLDALRARNMMPEPRNYGNWRDAVLSVERAATEGTYEEMWHLPGERTYRVTGRPQADGGFALLMEDVSAEIGLTRKYRAQIEIGHQVIDALEDAIAVFDGSGILVLSNAAYDALWNVTTAQNLGQVTLDDAFATWTAASRPCGTWSDARAFISRDHGRAPWGDTVDLADGRRIRAQFSPLPRNSSLARFRLEDSAERGTVLPIGAARPHLRA